MSQTTTNPESAKQSVEPTSNRAADAPAILTIKKVELREITRKNSLTNEEYKAHVLWFTFKESFEYFVKEQDGIDFVATKRNTLSMPLSMVTDMLSDMSDDIALMLSLPIEMTVCKQAYANMSNMFKLQALLVTLLIGAKAKLFTEFHESADEADGEDRYYYNISEFHLADKAFERVEKLS